MLLPSITTWDGGAKESLNVLLERRWQTTGMTVCGVRTWEMKERWCWFSNLDCVLLTVTVVVQALVFIFLAQNHKG
jgi:hypothetical protein